MTDEFIAGKTYNVATPHGPPYEGLLLEEMERDGTVGFGTMTFCDPTDPAVKVMARWNPGDDLPMAYDIAVPDGKNWAWVDPLMKPPVEVDLSQIESDLEAVAKKFPYPPHTKVAKFTVGLEKALYDSLKISGEIIKEPETELVAIGDTGVGLSLGAKWYSGAELKPMTLNERLRKILTNAAQEIQFAMHEVSDPSLKDKLSITFAAGGTPKTLILQLEEMK